MAKKKGSSGNNGGGGGSGGRRMGRGGNKDAASKSMSPPPPMEKKRSRRGRKKNNSNLKTSDDHHFRHSLESDGRWTIVEMESDGNCLFRSLSDQLYSDYGNDHPTIRGEVCDYIQEHEDEFCVFLVLDEEEEDEDAADFKSYVRNMRDDGEWGGNLELVAASRLYRVNITVFQANQSALTIGCGDAGGNSNGSYRRDNRPTPDVFLSYHDNGHYNSVRGTQQTPNPQQKHPPENMDGRRRRSYQRKDDEEYVDNERFATQKRPAKTRKNGENNNNTQHQQQQQHHQHERDERHKMQQIQNDSQTDSNRNSNNANTCSKINQRPPRKNDACPCGSSLRYKKCCLAKEKHAQRVMKLRSKGDNDTTSDSLRGGQGNKNGDDSNEYEMNGNFRVLMI